MRIKSFIEKMRRVMLIATKPTKEEFKVSAKISALGMLVIGVIGFGIFVLASTLSELFLVILLVVLVGLMSVMK